MKRDIIVIAHNVRSAHNIGSILRTADGIGVKSVYFTGYTPYPIHPSDSRLPHIAKKVDAAISKTALGAENSQSWENRADIVELIDELRKDGFTICALEQVAGATLLPNLKPSPKTALIVGHEVEGMKPEIIQLCDQVIEIPMQGVKESFNVVQAAAMCLYHIRYFDKISQA